MTERRIMPKQPPQAPQVEFDYGVVGLGVTGLSVVRHLVARGARVRVFDTRPEPPQATILQQEFSAVDLITGKLEVAALCTCRKLVVSPGLSLEQTALQAAAAAGTTLLGDIELFAESVTAPVIAITGTNGKSTVTTLVAELLKAGGFRVAAGGNLGTPALDLLPDSTPDFYVLELSSFQLERTFSLKPEVACILNLAPDHIDRHGSFDQYVAAKARIFNGAKRVVVNLDDEISRELGTTQTAQRSNFALSHATDADVYLRGDTHTEWISDRHGELISCDELPLVGRHNQANVLAALAIAIPLGVSREQAKTVLAGFKGLPHRSELVAEIAGVRYVNDSKATNPGAATASIRGVLSQHKGVVIAGGVSKGTPFNEFADALVAHAHSVILIGEAAGEISQVLNGRANVVTAISLDAAVRLASELCRPGQVVLLAPACASFDQFVDYQARGDAFVRAVKMLEAGA